MNACPECGGLLLADDDDDDFTLNPTPDNYFCPGCGWHSGEDDGSLDEDDNAFQFCSNCDGHDACADFGCAIKMGLGHLVQPDSPL